MALNLISSNRIKLDEALASLEGVHFFFLSITGITLNATEKISKQKKKEKKRKSSEVDDENVADDTAAEEDAEEEEQFDITFDPGVAYLYLIHQISSAMKTLFTSFLTRMTCIAK